MENNKNDIESLIAGFFTNSLSVDDLNRLNNWLDEDVSHLDEFNRMRSTWIMAGFDTGKKNFDRLPAWQKTEHRIESAKSRRFKRLAPLRYAASLLFFFALGAAISAFVLRRPPDRQTASATPTTVRVPLGAKSSVTLPDGSFVWLNAGSEITYFSDFGTEKRDLQLIGEAFFDVKSDSLMPFNVHTSGMTVRALGTRFNVKAYPEDSVIAATLEEGVVDVMIKTSSKGKNSGQSVKLKPKEQLVIRKNPKAAKPAKQVQAADPPVTSQDAMVKEIIIKPDVKTELSTSWKDDKWIISDESLMFFAANLERRYNVSIRFASEELKEYNFSGTFENETVEQVLTALSLAAPVDYKFNKNHVILSLDQTAKGKFSKILKNKK